MARSDPLQAYKKKRDFSKTHEPEDGGAASETARAFVIQKHWATRLHYDLRLELNGAMKSWAVPKGPSFDPKVKRMAIQVEDHPIAYNAFEGEIPARQYGAGKVIIWDKGTWQPLEDPQQAYRDGNLKFTLHGHKLSGKWALIRIKGAAAEKQPPWLLIKEKDAFARPETEFSVVDELPDSVAQLSTPAAIQETPDGARKATKRAVPSVAKLTARPPGVTVPVGAVKMALPDRLTPQLATLVDAPPSDSAQWLYEIKFDGYRLLTRIKGQKISAADPQCQRLDAQTARFA